MHLLTPLQQPALFEHRCAEVQVSSDVVFGADAIITIAGPCAVESEEQIFSTAEYIQKAGIKVLRGGAFKPRTNPHDFQGLGVEGLQLIKACAKHYGLKVVCELMSTDKLDDFLSLDIDIIQVGSRNMQNFDLLKVLGQTNKPIVLKRGIAATLSEWINAAEYIAMGGNNQIIFCERGVRGFEPSYRNLFDISAIPLLKKETGFPVIADPSHATGRIDLIPQIAKAAIAAGCDGVMLETHYRPSTALSDKQQALSPELFTETIQSLRPLATAMNRTLT